MSSKNKSQLRTENSTNFPNNNTQFITPERLRGFNNDMIDSLVVSSDSGSFIITSSFDNGTRNLTFTKGDGTTYTNNIPGGGGSVDTGSLLTTASVSDATITFTKGNASQFSIEVDNVTSSLQTQDVFVTVKNTSGDTINKGLAVHATGVTGENINVKLADSTNASDMPAIGLLETTLTNNSTGRAIISGRLKNIDTSALVAGESVYVNGAGTLTSTKPTGSDLIQNIGIAGKINATDGEIVVVGSGRSNDLPNILEGYIWVGDSNGVPEAISTGSFVKEAETGSFARTDTGNTFTTGSQIIQSNNGIILQTDGGGTTGQVQITPGANPPNKFTPAKLTGIEYLDVLAISSSEQYIGRVGNVVSVNSTSGGGSAKVGLGFGTGNQKLQILSGSNTATFNVDAVNINGNLTSSIAKSNIIVNPQTITDNVTIGENSNGLVVGDVSFAGTVTIGSGSELTIFDEPNLGGLIETASISGQTITFTKQDTSTFDIQIPDTSPIDTGSFATTGSNTFIGNQTVSGSLTAFDGLETGQPSQYPNGTGNLGVYGNLILRSGSGIVTDGSFGSSVPFDNPVAFFNGISLQQTNIDNVKYLEFNQEDPLPSVGTPGGRLAASGSAGNVNLYWSNGTTWTKLN